MTDKQLAESRKRIKKARVELDKAVEASDEERQEQAASAVRAAEAFRGYVLGRRKTSRIAATLGAQYLNVSPIMLTLVFALEEAAARISAK